MSAAMASRFKELSQRLRPIELMIQPVDELGEPCTLSEIVTRIRAYRYMCPICGGLMGAHLKGTPHRHGVHVKPHPVRFKLTLPCVLCKTEIGLSDLIRANSGRLV